MVDEKEVKEVQDFDNKVQELGLTKLDSGLADIFEYAEGRGYGWRGIASEDPDKFQEALQYVRENKHNVE